MPIVLIPGGTGLIGNRLSQLLSQQGFEVNHLSRSKNTESPYQTYQWDAEKGYLEEEALQRADYIINLAGAGIADQRWTKARKKRIIDSRVESTRLLKRTLEGLGKKPKAYLSASAIGYYGDSGETLMTEDSPPGTGFLSESCIAWENAAKEIETLGIRTFVLRTGVALSTQGGALAKTLLPLHFFLGTYFGDGRQWFSWIHIDDLCRMYIEAIKDENMAGVFNGVAPQPARNKELVEELVKATGKPALVVPAPAFTLRLALGEMAHVVLDSAKVSSEKIAQAGFEFQFPELLPALKDVMARKI